MNNSIKGEYPKVNTSTTIQGLIEIPYSAKFSRGLIFVDFVG